MSLDDAKLFNVITLMQAGIPADKVTQAIAEDAKKTWDNIWSGIAPPRSLPGQPPAIDTGALSESVRIEHPTQKGKRMVSEGGEDAPYAAALEYGTLRMAARPHVRPVAEKTRKRAGKVGQAALNDALAKVTK